MTKLPLEGIRVLEMTLVWAGPYCASFLADLGAEVIRVESLATFAPTTRGTRARPTVDLSKPRGLEIFKDLVTTSDVFVENNVVNRMDRLGISYGMLKELK